MKRIIFLLIILSSTCISNAQNLQKIDSLKRLLATTIHDTTRLTIYNTWGEEIYLHQTDSALLLWQMAESLAEKFLAATPLPKPEIEIGIKKNLATSLNNQGYIFNSQGQKSKALHYYIKSYKICEEIKDKKGLASSLNNIGYIYRNQGDIQKAVEYFNKSIQIQEEIGDKKGLATSFNNIGDIYRSQGDISKALDYFSKNLKMQEEIGDKKFIARSLHNFGYVYRDLGEIPKALDYFSRSLKMQEEIGDKKGIATTLNNIGVIYKNQGEITKALSNYSKSLKIKEEIGDKQGITVSLNNLGTIYKNQGEMNKLLPKMCDSMFSKALDCYANSLKISKEINYKQGIAQSLSNMGSIYNNQNETQKTIDCYKKSLKIFEEVEDKDDVSLTLAALGEQYLHQNKIVNALENAALSYKIARELGFPANINRAANLYFSTYITTAEYDKAEPYALEIVALDNKSVLLNFSILSEREQEMFLSTLVSDYMSFNSFALKRKQQNPAITEQVYNNTIKNKGLLLKSSTSMRKAVSTSNDTLLIKSYEKWIWYKKKIATFYTEGKDTKELEAYANELEKILIKGSQQFSDFKNLETLNWRDVQENLKIEEVAIEFVRVSQQQCAAPVEISTVVNREPKSPNDSILYAALIVRPGYKYPEMIPLFNEKDLQKLMLREKTNSDEQYVSELYSKDSNGSSSLYKLIFRPMERYLKSAKTLYFSPVGLLNKISFAAVSCGKDSLLSDKYKLNVLSNTREIINNYVGNKLPARATAVVYGGVMYDLKIDQIRTISSKQHIQINYPENATNLSGGWEYLLGTYKEAHFVNDIFLKNKLITYVNTGTAATEENFKHLGDSVSPTILHISTHGFFSPEPDAETFTRTQNIFKISKDPLWRSGLLLAGANYIWQTNNSIENVEDGVLTAWEISNINLRNTKLAVLSACETGLGDIKGTEGVFGLQRGFKMAGVDYIIMSLWQVPDEQTVELMTKFYNNCFVGMTIREAFRKAQNDLRKKQEPYYWAAFVLME